MPLDERLEERLQHLCATMGSLEQGIERLADQLIVSTPGMSPEDSARLEPMLHEIADGAQRCHTYAQDARRRLHRPADSNRS